MASMHQPSVSQDSEARTVVDHSRQYSVRSSTTHTTVTAHDHHLNQLNLNHDRSASPDITYCDALSQQSTDSDRLLALPQWSTLGERKRSNYSSEKRSISAKSYLAPLPILRWVKLALEVFMTLWAGYSTGRYLWAFTIYGSLLGQIAAIGLGICAGLGFAFSVCSAVLSVLQLRLLAHGIPVKLLLSLRSTLRYLASGCLAIPAVINIILVFVWKNNTDPELRFNDRCSLDVDLLWSTTASPCNNNRSWTPWIITGFLRLVVTSVFIITFHLIVSLPQFALVRRREKVRFIGSKKSHTRLPSTPGPNRRSTHSGHSSNNISNATSGTRPTTHPDVHASDTSFSSKASPRNRVRATRSRTTTGSSANTTSDVPSYNNPNFNAPPGATSPSPESTERDFGGFVDRFRALISQITRETEEGLAFARSDSASSHRSRGSSVNGTGNAASPLYQDRLPPLDDDEDNVDRHDDIEAPGYYAGGYGIPPGVVAAANGGYAPPAPHYYGNSNRNGNGHAYGNEFGRSYGDRDHDDDDEDDDDEDSEEDFYHGAASSNGNTNGRLHTVNPGDYHQQPYYPAEEHVRMMNGYIRRMPTIESMGSKELRSSLGASSAGGRTNGRSPTPGLGTANGREGEVVLDASTKSRPSSLSAQAEILAGLNGMGVGSSSTRAGSPSPSKPQQYHSTSEIGELMTIRRVAPPSPSKGASPGLTSLDEDDTPSLPAFISTPSPSHSPAKPSPLNPKHTNAAPSSPTPAGLLSVPNPFSSSSSSLLSPHSSTNTKNPHYPQSTTSSANSGRSGESEALSFHTASTGSTVDSLRRAVSEAAGSDFPLPPDVDEFKPSPRVIVAEIGAEGK